MADTADTLTIVVRIQPVRLTDGSTVYDLHLGDEPNLILSCVSRADAEALAAKICEAIAAHTNDKTLLVRG